LAGSGKILLLAFFPFTGTLAFTENLLLLEAIFFFWQETKEKTRKERKIAKDFIRDFLQLRQCMEKKSYTILERIYIILS
jgi:hypothetical protein